MGIRSIAALLAGHLACGAPTPACPPRTVADSERAQAVLAVARGARAGHELDHATICFGGRDRGAVLPDGVFVISSSLDHAAAAARLIHLHKHVVEGLLRFPVPGLACDLQMKDVMTAEARAIAAEITACEELGCADPPYTFAPQVLAAAPDDRVDQVLARMRDSSATDELDGMLLRYRARCEEIQ